MVSTSFPQVIRAILKDLPKNDYPALSTFSFVSCWLEFVMDKSVVSMRDLCTRLNYQGIDLKISTFSKASKTRETQVFQTIIKKLNKKLRQLKGQEQAKALFPIDSTIVTLTSKLLWKQGYHQFKLFCGLDSWTSEVEGIVIHFGQGHDHKYGTETVKATPENRVSIMDRGFASSERIREIESQENTCYVLRIKNDVTLEMLENGKCKVGKDEREVEVRVVAFCDLESRSEFRLATNLPPEESQKIETFSNEEIAEIYIQRWQIELLWKFLKMHLKLDRIITKNENGIRVQVFCCLIAYLILQLIEIPREFGEKLLDKLRYLQSYMCQEISYVHWFRKLIWIR